MKEVIRKTVPQGVSDDGINIVGFVVMHHLLIQREKFEPIWTLLRHYGYADDLQLAPEFICPPYVLRTLHRDKLIILTGNLPWGRKERNFDMS